MFAITLSCALGEEHETILLISRGDLGRLQHLKAVNNYQKEVHLRSYHLILDARCPRSDSDFRHFRYTAELDPNQFEANVSLT